MNVSHKRIMAQCEEYKCHSSIRTFNRILALDEYIKQPYRQLQKKSSPRRYKFWKIQSFDDEVLNEFC